MRDVIYLISPSLFPHDVEFWQCLFWNLIEKKDVRVLTGRPAFHCDPKPGEEVEYIVRGPRLDKQ